MFRHVTTARGRREVAEAGERACLLGKIEGRVAAGAARKRARKAERARKAAKRGGLGARDSKRNEMGDADAEANAARSRAWILTEDRPQPFCSLCKIDIANNPKAIKAHLKSKPHKTALRSTQPEHHNASSEQAKAQKSTKSEKKEKKHKKDDSDSDSESSDSV